MNAANGVSALIVRLLGIGGPRGWRSCRCVIIKELSLVCLTPVDATGRGPDRLGSNALGGVISTKGVRYVVTNRRGARSCCPLGHFVIAGRGERNVTASWKRFSVDDLGVCTVFSRLCWGRGVLVLSSVGAALTANLVLLCRPAGPLSSDMGVPSVGSGV
jgi:hypothetical protein